MAVVAKAELLKRFGASMRQESAALFIGAGFSRPQGFVDWRGLLKEIALDLELDINKESDLVAVAQYHVNSRGGRARINEVLIDEFNKNVALGENHRLIASLPVKSIWTTNYDTLIEKAFEDAKKRLDVKTSVANLGQTVPYRDAVLYKMHGDKSQPQDAILTKEDYETYNEKRRAYTTILKGELIERTFLFIGFSFTDPNIDYILARVRGLQGEDPRDHFCIMKRPEAPSKGDPAAAVAQFEYEKRKLELRIGDLQRYKIHAIMIDTYSEITEILTSLAKAAHAKDILISGSAEVYTPLGRARVERLLIELGARIVSKGFRLISGFGLGIGSSIAYGALNAIYSGGGNPEQAVLMPFPQTLPSGVERTTFNSAHREQMVRAAGFVIFVSGNRSTDMKVEMAAGVLEEFAIAIKLNRIPIPIGATGWAAAEILVEVKADLQRYYRGADVSPDLEILNDTNASDESYIRAIFSIIDRVGN